jgi:hypothetical protein
MERSFSKPLSPDILFWSMVGDVNADDVQRLFAEQAAFSKGSPGFYVVVDMSRMKQTSSEARREAARAPKVDGKPMPVLAIAIVGGSFHLRLLGKMINTAAAILNKIHVRPIEFFNTLEESLAWIDKLKQTKTSA